MRSTFAAAILSVFVASTLLAASPPKVESYSIDVAFVPQEASMHGWTAITFVPTEPLGDTVTFYLHGELEVDSIVQSDKLLDFSQEKVLHGCDYSYVATKADMVPKSSSPADTITVFYHGYFNPSKARAQSNYMRVDGDGVFLRGLGYSPWFPIFLESWRDSYPVDFADVTIRTPKGYMTVVGGRHLGDAIDGDTRTSRWQALNTQQFMIQLTSQRYNKTSLGNIHVYYWDDSASIASAEKIADLVSKLTRRFEESYRSDVAATEYHIVEMPEYGDISAGNVSGLQVESWRQFDQVAWAQRGLAHEIVHPFVRLEVDKNDPLYALHIEGFPSFFHLPILEEIRGREWYDAFMRRIEERYLEAKATGKDRWDNDLPVEKPIDQITGDEVGEYKDVFILCDRAVLFMNYVRVKMGEKAFADFCHDLFGRKVLTNESFREMVSTYLGGAREDVDLWLSGTEYPERFRLENL